VEVLESTMISTQTVDISHAKVAAFHYTLLLPSSKTVGGSPSTSATTQETSATLEAERSMVKWKCTATIAEGTWGMSFMGREARHLNVTESTRSVSSM